MLRGDPLHVEPIVASAGSIRAGEPGTANFRVTNPWLGRVTIVGLQSNCACVSGERLPLAVEAGETRSLPVRIEPTMVGAPKAFEQTVILVTDRDGPRPALRIRGTYLPDSALSLGEPVPDPATIQVSPDGPHEDLAQGRTSR